MALCLPGLALQAKPNLIFSLPRLAATDPASARINADLVRQDTRNLEILQDCQGERSATVTFLGDAFISLSISAGGYCQGAAHPFHMQSHLSYDLATGAALDWFTLLPAALLTDDISKPAEPADGFKSGALTTLYLDHRKPRTAADLTDETKCRSYIKDAANVRFDLWLDQANHALAIEPAGLAYAATACIEPVYIPIQTLHSLGADPRLIKALRADSD